MKKFFITLGVIFLVLIVAAGIGFWYIAARGNALDKESKVYADATIPVIVTTWNDQGLLDRASPEFKQAVPKQQLDQQFHRFAGLGHLKMCEPAHGQSFMSATTQGGKRVTAEYYANATFDKGQAVIDIALIKHGDQWQIFGFFVKSAALPLH